MREDKNVVSSDIQQYYFARNTYDQSGVVVIDESDDCTFPKTYKCYNKITDIFEGQYFIKLDFETLRTFEILDGDPEPVEEEEVGEKELLEELEKVEEEKEEPEKPPENGEEQPERGEDGPEVALE